MVDSRGRNRRASARGIHRKTINRGDKMDGETITAVAVTATVNVVTIVSMIYYLKGKVETLEKNIDKRIDDIKDYINDRFNDFYKMFNTRIKNIENIVYREG